MARNSRSLHAHAMRHSTGITEVVDEAIALGMVLALVKRTDEAVQPITTLVEAIARERDSYSRQGRYWVAWQIVYERWLLVQHSAQEGGKDSTPCTTAP